MTKEIRQALGLELRTEGENILVEGYAAVFNQDANIGDYFIERIEPGAFADAIGRDDVVFLINHEGLPLARTRSGTLKLFEDDHGLGISTELDLSDPDVLQIVPKMKRGDLDKMSFAFRAEVQEWDESGDLPIRTITQAALYDVSIVTTPAYDGTDIGLRKVLDQHQADQRKINFEATRRRLKMKLDHDLRSRSAD